VNVVRRIRFLLPLVLIAAAAWAFGSDVAADGTVSHFSWFDGWARDPYVLDGVERFMESPGQRPECPTADIVRHRGTHLRYAGPARVHKAFVPRLERFERVVQELATEHYGRAPHRILHRGAFNCRRARGRRARVSEHALGNALDLRGFEFRGLPRDATAPDDMPRRMRRGFRITILEHWGPRRPRDEHHAEFLHELADTLRGRPDIFRGIVGPPRPRHGNHLHLDAAPWRYAMYGYDEE